MKTDDLISQLARDLKPVRRPENSFVFALKWSLVSFLLIAILLGFVKPRGDLRESLQGMDTVFQILSFAGVLFAGLLLLSWNSSPGRGRQKTYSRVFFLLIGIYALVNWIRFFDLNPEVMSEGMELLGSRCALLTIAVGFLTGAIFSFKARQGASTHPLRSGAIVGLAALGAGGVAITLHCGNNNGMHILLWHFLVPFVVMVFFGLAVGKKILHW